MKTSKETKSDFFELKINKQRSLAIFGAILSSILIILNFQFIDWNLVKAAFFLNPIIKSYESIKEYLFQIYLLFFSYVFSSLFVISIVALIKGGYRNLKSYKEVGFIWVSVWGVILGVILGFILGVISGFIWGVISGFIWGVIVGFILGFISGFIWGVIVGFISGFIFGLFYEFEK